MLSSNSGISLQGVPAIIDVDRDGKNEVVACLEGSNLLPTGQVVGGELVCLSNQGRDMRRLKFDGKIRIGSRDYEGPWPASAWGIVEKPSQPMLLMAVHHFTSWPGIIVAFDPFGNIVGQFVNAGWIKTLQTFKTPAGTRLLAGGISNSNDAGMLAVLDSEDINGSSPENAEYTCSSCSRKKPAAYFVFPRSELNLNTDSQYNQVFAIDSFSDRFTVHTFEVRQEISGGEDRIDAIYEFTPNMEIGHAYFNDRYLDLHRRLEMEGKLRHSKAKCPDRNGPQAVRKWTTEGGWEEIKITPELVSYSLP